MKRVAVIAAGLVVAGLAVRGGVRLAQSRGEVDFNRDVRPILNSQCAPCHGGVRQQSDLSLLFREDALKPAKSGKVAIVPGDPDGSEMVRRITHPDQHDRMPKGRGPLSATEIAAIKRWIKQGAPWEPHWAYLKPVAAPLPPVSDPSWPKNGLDHFVLARLDRERLSPSPEADCPTLARRMSLDLIGLPPRLDSVDSLCAAPTPGRYEAFADWLLASASFGERWAAMWLDLARYADTQGYEKDYSRSVWRFRDWVIEAFNRDLPFDQFTAEQLAGDLLPNATANQLIATAFHRNTMNNDEGGTDDEEHRVASVIDRVNTTWVVWQGTSMACAQCHGHPYDPFRHQDYYRSFAYFNNTADWDQTDEQPVLPQFRPDQEARGQALFAAIQRLAAEAESLVATPELVTARRNWEGQVLVPAVAGKFKDTWQNEVLRIVRIPEGSRDGEQRAKLAFVFAEGSDDPRLAAIRKRRSEAWKALRSLDPTLTPVMQELPPGHRRKTYRLDRGNFLTRAEEVEPGVPASVGPSLDGLEPNRLGLAKWLTHPDNPLTARVTVNRFWEQLFGIGLVETSEDFGTQGAPPSDQALLDWLAVRFQAGHRWRIKPFLKEIVLSATYRQSSNTRPELIERDPHNRLLARGPRFRLTAEQIRDQALFVGGLLSDRRLGPSVMPPQPAGLWAQPYNGEQWTAATDENRYRRALYTFWKRTAPYPSALTFDSPTREFCVARRLRTNTPLQALVTLNDPAFVEAANGLAARMAQATELERSLELGFQLALLRRPDSRTVASLTTLYRQAVEYYRTDRDAGAKLVGRAGGTAEAAALSVVANAILNLDEFLTKE
ncbi:MAG: PSD1 and planctomycete cytochrome C domain-containing protein [Gemmatimonadales bacterium]